MECRREVGAVFLSRHAIRSTAPHARRMMDARDVMRGGGSRDLGGRFHFVLACLPSTQYPLIPSGAICFVSCFNFFAYELALVSQFTVLFEP